MTVTAISPAAAKNDNRAKLLTKRLNKLGADEADGKLAKPSMAIAIVDACIDGVITHKDAEATFDAYLDGKLATKNDNGKESVNEDSRKANISKNRQLLKAAELKSGGIKFNDVLTECSKIRAELFGQGVVVKPAFDAFVDCARAQLKSPKVQIGASEIRAASSVAVREQADKAGFELLQEDYRRMWKRAEDMPNNTHLPAVLAALQAAIVEAGGVVPAVTEAEKEAEKAVKKLEALGFKMNFRDLMN